MEEKQGMEDRQDLYNDLLELRRHLKDREKLKTGRAPVICTDDAIQEMIRLMPRKASDFYSVPGIGSSFVENYAEDFLAVLWKNSTVNADALYTKDTEKILRELSKKLINISHANRMLFMPKLGSKYAVDLFNDDGSYHPLDILFGDGDAVCVADISALDAPRHRPAHERYKALNILLREVTREMRDKGLNDLYIGYPFVQGCLSGTDFSVRAPLCLFPVTLEKTGHGFEVELDVTRDVIYNSTLLLAHNKFNSIFNPLPDCTLDEPDPDTFLHTLLTFYEKNGLRILYNSNELEKFESYPADRFPHYESGAMKLVHNVVIGKFPAYSNSIQRDLEELLNRKLLNRAVCDLVTDYGETDFYKPTEETSHRSDPTDKADISEEALVYINPLNSAQEAVLKAADELNELVIEGPPGTGKSQTITSLITQAVHQGKTVLMVSEKKTALDVVYSRLGELSRYAIMIDDANNKTPFYARLDRMLFSADAEAPMEDPVDLSALSKQIDTNLQALQGIAELLFQKGTFGIEPYKLYLENRRIHLDTPEQISRYRAVRSILSDELLSKDYADVHALYQTFSDERLTEALTRYHATVAQYPWFLKMRSDLSDYDLILLADTIDEVARKHLEWETLPFFKRIFALYKHFHALSKSIKGYFQKKKAWYALRLILKNETEVKRSLKVYTRDYAELIPSVSKLSEQEQAYLALLQALQKKNGNTLAECNVEIYNAVLFEHIQRFETAHRELLATVASFESIVDTIDQGITQKQALARQSIARILSEELSYITASKRKGEIQRAVESKRHSSIAKFVEKFNFELFKGIKIWLMTPEAVSEILPRQTGLFDLLIFDEASQLYVEKSIPSIVRAQKVVIAGDSKQLRPSSLGEGRIELVDEDDEDMEVSAVLEEESLLDLARFRYQGILLNTHYRSKYEELIDFSNHAFYQGRLFVAPNTDIPERPPIEVHTVKNAIWEKRSNRKEAERIVELLKDILKNRKNRETVGIIAFNVSQRDLIHDLIDEEGVKDPAFGAAVRLESDRKDNGEDTGLFIKNIESVQGDERDIIIFSIGYANNKSGKLVRNFGWLNQKGGENRLNVAISRAKQKIHIVTSFHPSELDVSDMKNQGPLILKKYLEYAHAISNGDRHDAERVLNSFGEATTAAPATVETALAQEIAKKLTRKGYDVDTQVGIGGYHIDVAVRKDGGYILGIECDSKLYRTSLSARERDYHRQKYLESRGWHVKRIWGMDWWRDPERELEKLCELIHTISGDPAPFDALDSAFEEKDVTDLGGIS